MRARLKLAAPALLVAALALAGCSTGSTTTDPTPTATTSTEGTSTGVDPKVDLCGAAFESGDVVDAIAVEGGVDVEPTISLASAPEITDVQRKVVVEGDGEKVEYGQLLNVAQTIFDATTGAKVGDIGWTTAMTPQALVSDNGMAEVIGCATIGSRIVATTPASGERPAYIWVFDVQGVTPSIAWGAEQPAVEGMPTVELAENGQPTVTIPQTEAPTEVKLATLKEGDGAVVQPGDNVTLQYMGVKWSDGSEFDSSWSRDATPMSLPTNGVVDGFRQAMEGYKVGSQVLVVVPPAFGYGATPGHELEKETLVFVVDILATAGATPAG